LKAVRVQCVSRIFFQITRCTYSEGAHCAMYIHASTAWEKISNIADTMMVVWSSSSSLAMVKTILKLAAMQRYGRYLCDLTENLTALT
jgi:hypothetical protein